MTARPASSRVKPLGVALFGVALLSSLVHMGLVRHEVCSDHGELVEAERTAVHADIRAAGLHSLKGAIDGDEHCPLTIAPSRREMHAPALGAPVLVAAAPARDEAALAHAERRALDVLDVAPKHGPPSQQA